MTREGRPVGTDAEDAAKILRGVKERVDRLEKDRTVDDGVQVYRSITETVIISDSVSVTSGSRGGFVWNESKWGLADWNGNIDLTDGFGVDGYGDDGYGE